jgi:hypothetical protein
MMRLFGSTILCREPFILFVSGALLLVLGFISASALAEDDEAFRGFFKTRKYEFKTLDPGTLVLQVQALTTGNLAALNEMKEAGDFYTNVKSLTTVSVRALPTNIKFDRSGAAAFGTVIQDAADRLVMNKRNDKLAAAGEKARTLVTSMASKAIKQKNGPNELKLIGIDLVRDTIDESGGIYPIDPFPTPTSTTTPTPTPVPGD